MAGFSAASIAEKGSSNGRFMKACPSTCATKTRRPPGASKKRAPRPGAARAKFSGRITRGSCLDEGEHVALVEGMVAEGDAVGAGLEQQRGVRAAQPHAAGGVLAVDHDEVERPVAPQARQVLGSGGAAAAAHDVAEKEKLHGPRMGRNRRAASRPGGGSAVAHAELEQIAPVEVPVARKARENGAMGAPRRVSQAYANVSAKRYAYPCRRLRLGGTGHQSLRGTHATDVMHGNIAVMTQRVCMLGRSHRRLKPASAPPPR